MNLEIELTDLRDRREPWWILAWHDPGVITIRRPFHRIFFALARIAHEIGHEDPDEGHHPWWHFCLRSPGALRIRWIHSRVSRSEARDLARTVD